MTTSNSRWPNPWPRAKGGGLAAAASQLGAGLAMGQQIAQTMGAAASPPRRSVIRPLRPRRPPCRRSSPSPAREPPAASFRAAAELLTPANAAQILNVSENDVLSALADGSLKGKKIGATWRITRAALDEFLKA